MIRRVAYVSIHTSPLAQPGAGDAGGMNVYVDQLARTMAGRGVDVDVYTRPGDGVHRVVEVMPGYRVITIPSGPGTRAVAEDDLADLVGEFAERMVKFMAADDVVYDLVHSHYWLSGWVGALLQEMTGVPLAISFHTLGRVKEATRRVDDPPPSLLRIAAEVEVIARAGCVVASTPAEAGELIEHYAADPERLCVSPPGVNHDIFFPGSKSAARESLGIAQDPLVLYVGRIQPLKGLDLGIEAFAEVTGSLPSAQMLIVGGPSGDLGEAEVAMLRSMVAEAGLSDRVTFAGTLSHSSVADAYRAADVLIVPSRSESFGMVAAEAQSCGLPVVAARVGGLAYAVDDGISGTLISGWDPGDYAKALLGILNDPLEAGRLSAGAVAHAERFSWQQTVDRMLELYQGITGA